jgi:hypothetical protein
MRIAPKSIAVGQCYLGAKGHIRRVLELRPDGTVRYETRRGPVREGHPWPRSASTTIRFFAMSAQRPVPYDWTPETDEAEGSHSQSRG